MTKRFFLILIVAISFFRMNDGDCYADGKLLVFSIPKERVQKEIVPSKDPIKLVDFSSPDNRPSKASAQGSASDRARTATPTFPVPKPTESVQRFWEGGIPTLEIPTPPRNHQSTAKTTTNSQKKGSNASKDSNQGYNEILWKEQYRGEIKCAQPQYARDLNAFIHEFVKYPVEKVLDPKDKSLISAIRSYGECRFFNQPEINVVIAWNGKSDSHGVETMIVSAKEETLNGLSSAALSITPLPGMPISVRVVDNDVYQETEKLFLDKAPASDNKLNGVAPEINVSRTTEPHNVFIWRLDDINDLYSQVSNYLDQKYGGQAAVALDSDSLRAIQFYFERGFRYFAFDLAEVGRTSTKRAIAYTFQSSHIYYPLVINAVGGSDEYSAINLMIITPGKISVNGAITELLREDKEITAENQAILVGNGAAYFSIKEVQSINSSLNVFDSNISRVQVRNIRFFQIFNSFTKDFTATGLENNKAQLAPQHENSEAKTEHKFNELAPSRNSSSTFVELPRSRAPKDGIVDKTDSTKQQTSNKQDKQKEGKSALIPADENSNDQDTIEHAENGMEDIEVKLEETNPNVSGEVKNEQDTRIVEPENSDGPTPAPVPETENNVTSDPENK